MLSYRQFFEQFEAEFELEWLSLGGVDLQHPLRLASEGRIGFLNLIRPFSIQIVGKLEYSFLCGLGKNSKSDSLDKLFSEPVRLVVLTDGIRDDEFHHKSVKAQIPLLACNTGGEEFFRSVSHRLNRSLAEKETLHGVFMQVKGVGVLLRGESGVGKSELALELISHGHQLIADDAPFFHRSDSGRIYGSSPEILQDFIEVRGLGVLNVRAMYGDSAIKKQEQLNLIIELYLFGGEGVKNGERLSVDMVETKIMNALIPTIRLEVAPGRNLRVLVEAAVSNFVLWERGYSPTEEMRGRLRKQMAKVE